MQSHSKSSVVIYQSKYGTTKCYAQWIAEKLDAELFDVADFDVTQLKNYSTILFGSSVHIGKVKGISVIIDNWEVLSKKKVVVFASIGSPNYDDPKQQKVIQASVPKEILDYIKYFALPGSYSYKKLDFKDKLLMNLGPRLNLIFKSWFKGDQKAKNQLNQFCEDQNWMKEEAIKPILSHIQET